MDEISAMVNNNIPDNEMLICRIDQFGRTKVRVWNIETEDISPEFIAVLNEDFWELIYGK